MLFVRWHYRAGVYVRSHYRRPQRLPMAGQAPLLWPVTAGAAPRAVLRAARRYAPAPASGPGSPPLAHTASRAT